MKNKLLVFLLLFSSFLYVSTGILLAEDDEELASYYFINKTGYGKEKTITVDGIISDWDSSMIIAQGAANDDPRVYRYNSMDDFPVDTYTLYGAFDDENLYLMWEMTNVQDVVAPNDEGPLTEGVLWKDQEFPFYMFINTKNPKTMVGNKGRFTNNNTIGASKIMVNSDFNKVLTFNSKGQNFKIYSGTSAGLNTTPEYSGDDVGITIKYGKGILSRQVLGIAGGYGPNNDRVPKDMCNENAKWINFVTKRHKLASMDYFYEMSIPLEKLGLTKKDVDVTGIGVLLVATAGGSGVDSLPYDLTLNDNAAVKDTTDATKSYEKNDADLFTTKFAFVCARVPEEKLELTMSVDKTQPQHIGTDIVIKGKAEGGIAPYEYSFYANDKLLATKTTTGNVTVTWVPIIHGKYNLKCIVKDSSGNEVYVEKDYSVLNAPSSITNPVVTAEDGLVKVTWDFVGKATKYQVVSYINGRYTVQGVNLTTNSYVVEELTNDLTYGFLVRAYINGGWTTYGLEDLVYATPKRTVIVPDIKEENGHLILDWDPVEGATKYQVCTHLNGKYIVQDKNVIDSSYTILNLENDITYGILIRFFKNGKWSDYGIEDLSYATPTSKLTLVPNNNQVKVSWRAVYGATKYQLCSYFNGKFTVQVNNYLKTNYTVTGLVNGYEYGFLIRYYKDGVWSSYSKNDLTYVMVGGITKPIVTVTAELGGVSVSWVAPSGATKYQVCTYLNGKYNVWANNYTSNSIKITGLTSGVKYGILVRAYIGGKWSTYTINDLVYATPF